MIYMKHPLLGNAHFRDDQQHVMEADGWVRWPRSKDAKQNKQEPAVLDSVDTNLGLTLASIRDQYIAKFGKPPHHRMLDETIRAALKE